MNNTWTFLYCVSGFAGHRHQDVVGYRERLCFVVLEEKRYKLEYIFVNAVQYPKLS